MDLYIDEMESPIGTITLVAGAGAIVALGFDGYGPRMRASLEAERGPVALRSSAAPQGFSSRISDYMSGDIDALSAIPVAARGSPFQRKVWAAVQSIPPGATRSYGDIAAAIGRPAAARAVGLANARNPVCLVIPCHRVIGAAGALTGYAFGLDRKRWLLSHEAAPAARTESPPPRRMMQIC